jgi:hypothetical protein
MYVSYLSGVRADWVGDARILHYTSADLVRWEFGSVLELGSDHVIDAAVHPLPDGSGRRMWFKDERDDSHLHTADSPDLYTWTRQRPAAVDQPQEGPTVFRLADAYWMVTDNWRGLSVYRSTDLTEWTREPYQLLAPHGHHAMALEQGEDHAVLCYFVPDDGDPTGRRSAVRTARLAVRTGRLTCDPNAPVPPLSAAAAPALRGGTRAP